jgi:hypothetical protein
VHAIETVVGWPHAALALATQLDTTLTTSVQKIACKESGAEAVATLSSWTIPGAAYDALTAITFWRMTSKTTMLRSRLHMSSSFRWGPALSHRVARCKLRRERTARYTPPGKLTS